MNSLTIGQLAKTSGVRTDTIRYYEKFQLIEPIGRTESDYRQYDASSVNRVVFIKRAKSLGFTLAEIKGLLELHVSKTGTAQDMLDLTRQKIEKAQKDITDLMNMKKTLETLADECLGGETSLSNCPIAAFLNNGEKHKG